MEPKDRMLLQCSVTKKFVKLNVEALRRGGEELPVWELVDSEEDATHDPGWVGGDNTLAMICYCREKYGSESFSCYTPGLDSAEQERSRHNLDRVSEEIVERSFQDVFVVGGAGGMGLSPVDIVKVLDSHELAKIVNGCVLPEKGFGKLKSSGYKPNRKEMRAMNKRSSSSSYLRR